MLVRLLEPNPILLDDPVRPKISPHRNMNGIESRMSGDATSPKSAITIVMVMPKITLLVAPQRSSPATRSSRFMGVARMASKVFWNVIRIYVP